jgi:predicted metal-binding membrane protein
VSTAVRLRDPAIGLWAVTACCWAVAVVLLVDGGHRHGPGAPGPFLLAWVVMVGAMMLPTTVPLVRLFAHVRARSPQPGGAVAALLGGYLAVWVAVAAIAYGVAVGVAATVAAVPWLAARPDVVVGLAVAAAGAYQFSALKEACLRACRSPATVLRREYRRGLAGAARLGVRHGFSCLGCCWALMLVMVLTGAAGLFWMLGLTAIMVVEKTTRAGARLAPVIGTGLIVVGGALVIAGV